MSRVIDSAATKSVSWLTRYYAIRAIFSLIWVGAAFAIGKSNALFASVLLVAYPAWDAIANFYDAKRNGGFKANPTQAFNAVVSTLVAIAVIAALNYDTHAVFDVFGVWAALAGLLQLATGIRRWRGFGAQWPMILSGAQSVLAGTHFIKRAADGIAPSPSDIALYAAFGAIYFAISASVLAISAARRRRAALTI